MEKPTGVVEAEGHWVRATGRRCLLAWTDLGPPPPSPAATLDRRKFWVILIFATMLLLMVSLNAHAAETTGDTLWSQLKNMWFGAPGLIVGAGCLIIGVIGFFRNGFGWTAVVFGVATVFFMIPGLAVSLQKWAQTIAG